jgi:carboxypeptidase family protein
MAPRYFVLLVALGLPAASAAQTSASFQGSVSDATGAVLPAATVRVHSQASAIDRSVSTTPDGRYFVVGLPAGRYQVTASATGFRSEVIEELVLEVERTVVRDFRLEVGVSRESVVVRAEIPLVERGTASVGHAVTPLTVQEIPLNGRRFVDLGLLVPGSVAPSQTGFSTTPIRGLGALAINTAGNARRPSDSTSTACPRTI